MVYIQVKLRTRVNDLAEWQSNGLDMIISLIDIDQRQGACLVEGKHLKLSNRLNSISKGLYLEKIDCLKKILSISLNDAMQQIIQEGTKRFHSKS